MIPPEAPERDTGMTPPAVSFCLTTLRKRADFLRAARAKRHARPTMLVQGRFRDDGDPTVRVGYTCSKKIGNAVTRNRAKRRLRAVAHDVLPTLALPGWDFVLVGRPDHTVASPYADLTDDLVRALTALRGQTR